MENSSDTKIISFGYRCSSAGILKQMGLKQESYPFDWLISKLHVVRDCIGTNFEHFLNVDNYVRKYAKSFEMIDITDCSNGGYFCDESLMVNMHYQPYDKQDEINAYRYNLAMNHNDITNPTNLEYFKRCVHRFQELMKSPNKKIYLHIFPLITLQKYETEKINIIEMCINFDDFVDNYSNQLTQGVFFILVRDTITKCGLLHYNEKNGTKVYILYTNKNFIDGGETFLGDYYQEQCIITNVVRYTLLSHSNAMSNEKKTSC